MTLASLFHPAVADWFARSFGAPTPAQQEAWPAIKDGRHVLIAAPTGSGKTLAAFLATICALVPALVDAMRARGIRGVEVATDPERQWRQRADVRDAVADVFARPD